MLAILAVRDLFFLGGFVVEGGLIVSLLFTLFRFVSDLVVALSFSCGASWGGGLLVTSTVILRCPSRGCMAPTAVPPVGFRWGEVGGNISEDEFEDIF